jgi:GNAT superfamily N-acetyltransferase
MNDYLRKFGVVASRAPWTDDEGKTHSIHSVGITPEMKRWLLHEGQAMLSEDTWNGEDPLDGLLKEPEPPAPVKRPPVAPAFYSKLDRAIEQKLPNTVTGHQALRTLIGAGVKPEELKHSKVQKLLERFSDAPLDKSAIRDQSSMYGVHVKPILRSDRANFNMSFDTARALHRDGKPVFGIHNITGEATDFGDLDFSGVSGKPYAYTFYPGEVSNKIERSSGLAKWRDYRLGGPRSNYNEMQLQLLVPGSRKLESFAKAAQEKYGLQWRGQLNDEERDEYSRLHDIQRNAPPEFYGDHWDEGNVLAHARFDDRTLGDGSRAMHVAEIQSDWHQAGRKKGYRDHKAIAALADEYEKAVAAQELARDELPEWKAYSAAILNLDTDRTELGDLYNAYSKALSSLPESVRVSQLSWALKSAQEDTVPDAPFKKNWHELMFKHLLQHAVDQGYDALSWDTGHTNAERFQQRKPMHQISWQPSTGELWGINDELGEHKIADGVTDQNLAQHVGKNAAAQLLAGDSEQEKYTRPGDGPNWRVIDGRGLMAGGAGMVGFYDKMLPEFVNKYLRHVGGGVEQGGLPGMHEPYHVAAGRWVVSNIDNGADDLTEYSTRPEAEAAAKELLHPVHVVKITPQIRDWIRREGQVTLNENPLGMSNPTPSPAHAKGLTDDEKHQHFFDGYRVAEEGVLEDFRRDMNAKQAWPVVSAGRLKKIWRDHANMGFVRDEKGLDEIADRMIQNVHRLQVNTGMCGHEGYSPADVWNQHYGYDDDYDDGMSWNDDISEKFGDHIEDENGQWRISDYAMKPLWDDAFELQFETDPTKRLMIIDRMLNRVHARSDMAANFVEGGSATLDELAGNTRKSSLPLLSEIESKTPRGLREAAIVALMEPEVAEPAAKPESGVHSIYTDHMDSHRGENYYETHARDKNGGLLGYASWSDMGGRGDMYLKHVEVRDTHRRRGIASAIYDHIRSENPGRNIRTFGGFRTDEGQAFREAYDKRSGIAPAVESVPMDKPKQTDSPEFRNWFGMSKVHHPHDDPSRPVEPMVVYHGTTRNFDTFDPEKAEVGADHGAGFYFTNDANDLSQNYANENGPDVQSRYEEAKERIESDNWEDPLPEEEVERLAREQIFEHGGASMPVYLRMENPLRIGGDTSDGYEWWDSIYEGDPEDEDYYDQYPTGRYHDFMNALREVTDGVSGVDFDKIREDLLDYEFEGGRPADILNKIKRSEGMMYAEDDNGKLISSELLRQAIANMGYDGIIDHTVYDKFGKFGTRPEDGKVSPYGMEGMNPDTTHYIVFHPNQIKSAIGNNGEFSRHLDHIGLSEASRRRRAGRRH